MEKPVLKLSISLLFLILSACGLKPTGDGSASSNIDSFHLISDNFSQSSTEMIKGSGSLVFNTLLGSPSARQSFAITFLLEEASSTLELIAFSDSQVSSGYKILFSKDGASLKVSVRNDGENSYDISPQFFSINAHAVLRLTIQWDNSSSTPRLLLWDEGVASSLTAELATYDSNDNEQISATKSVGSYWGVNLSTVELTRAALGSSVL